MLPRPLRLTSATDHRAVVRRGRRAGGGALTVHLLVESPAGPLPPDGAPARSPGAPGPRPGRAGLVVGKAVGNAVTRHRVSRQLRHLLATRITSLPAGSRIVVRAGPAAAAPQAQLGRDLDAALGRLTRARPPRGRSR